MLPPIQLHELDALKGWSLAQNETHAFYTVTWLKGLIRVTLEDGTAELFHNSRPFADPSAMAPQKYTFRGPYREDNLAQAIEATSASTDIPEWGERRNGNEKKEKMECLERIDRILKERYSQAFQNMTAHTTVQCRSCKLNFFFSNVAEKPRVDHGVISNAHGIVEGYQFRFPCPHCETMLRVDEDELELRVCAVSDEAHS